MKILNRLLIFLTIFTTISFSQSLENKESSQSFPLDQNGKWGYIDKTERAAIGSPSDESTSSSDDLAQSEASEKQQSKKPEYDYVGGFLKGWQ